LIIPDLGNVEHLIFICVLLSWKYWKLDLYTCSADFGIL